MKWIKKRVGIVAVSLISVMFFTLCSACGVSHGQDETQRNRRSIAMMLDRAIKLKEDGTVVAIGGNTNGECNVSDWKDIVDIEANNFLTIGLKSDGTVVLTGDYSYLPIDEIKAWKDIVAISADGAVVAGLKSDGTVVTATTTIKGEQPFITPDWTDIVDVAVGVSHIVGLKSDGTVVAYSPKGENVSECNVADWKNIIDIEASGFGTVGLKSDGTIRACGCVTSSGDDIIDTDPIFEAKNIQEVSKSGGCVMLLHKDNTVSFYGDWTWGKYYHQNIREEIKKLQD